MSKTQLRKTLASMTHEQVVEAVLEAYSANKDVKEYFEFFLNPDVEALTEKVMTALEKEIKRSRRGSAITRITQIKKRVKDYIAHGVGSNDVINLYIWILKVASALEFYNWYPERLVASYIGLLKDLLTYADRHSCVAEALKAVKGAINGMPAHSNIRRRMRDYLENSGLAD